VKVGLVAEGPADIAVLRNVLKGALGLDRRDVIALRPELSEDETDRAGARGPKWQQSETEYSNWELVLRECERRTLISDFVENQLAEDRFVVVQIDTAEVELPAFGVVRPPDRKAPDYVETLRERVVVRLRELLGEELWPRMRCAVAVEETDAWVLTLHDAADPDTCAHRDPKKRLERELGKGRKRSATGSAYVRYDELSHDFRKPKRLSEAARRNRSLLLFLVSLDDLADED
jgi:hypothetical protein